ncbi:MAG: hypothetical protein SH868_12885 [Bythopirellula sp.]|nr:hypothetical protein [Bythopirellula sp.]
MPIPDAQRAIASREKVHGYLLNHEHPDGGSKAVWFASLGYEQDDWQTLASDLLKIAKTCLQYDTELSAHGVKYKTSGSICCPGHRSGSVITVWIVEDKDPPRLITAYPDASS